MRWPIDLTGKQFGRWTVIGYRSDAYWTCRCQCGAERQVDGASLRRGASHSCGCALRDALRKRIIHGHARKRHRTGTYQSWYSMIQRCENPRSKFYSYYGGRGVHVIPAWRSFVSFLDDMGQRPDGLTLGRIDNSRGYDPGNCRWETRGQQQLNRRNNRMLMCGGRTQTVTEWAREYGMTREKIFHRLRAGYTDEEAILLPRGFYAREHRN